MSGFTLYGNGTTIATDPPHYGVQVYNVYVDVVRITLITGSTGMIEVETVVVSSMPADIRWSQGSEKIIFNKETWVRDATLHCRKQAGVDISTNDRIRYQGVDFEIVDVIDVRNLGKLLSLTLRRIK